jgi:hypothetical protein
MAITRMISTNISSKNITLPMMQFWNSEEGVSYFRSLVTMVSIRTKEPVLLKSSITDPNIMTLIDLESSIKFDNLKLAPIVHKYNLNTQRDINNSRALSNIPFRAFYEFVSTGITSIHQGFLKEKLDELRIELGEKVDHYLIGFRFTNGTKVFAPNFHIDFMTQFPKELFDNNSSRTNYLLSNGPQTEYIHADNSIMLPHIKSDMTSSEVYDKLTTDKEDKFPYSLFALTYLFDECIKAQSPPYLISKTTLLEWNAVSFNFIHRSAPKDQYEHHYGSRFCVLAYPDPKLG